MKRKEESRYGVISMFIGGLLIVGFIIGMFDSTRQYERGYLIGYNDSLLNSSLKFYHNGINDTVSAIRLGALKCQTLTIQYPEYNRTLHYIVYECINWTGVTK